MRESKFYRLSLTLPLAIPLLAALLEFLHARLPEWLLWVLVYTTFSGIIGGLPYLILIGGLLWWSRGKTDAQFKCALALLPILMLPVISVMIALGLSAEAWLKPENALPLADSFLMFLGLVPFILGFGYLYVVLVFSSASILKRRGLLVPSNAA